MSALPPKADIRGAKRNVRFVPIADIRTSLFRQLFDHFVRRASSEGGTVEPRTLAVLRLITNSNLAGP
jgi:hypothetical protein